MKSTLKKFLSITLVVSMLMSMCTFAFADGDAAAEQRSKQITTEGDTVYYKADGSQGTQNNWDVKLTRKLEATGTENLFNVNMEVVTKDSVRTETSADAAVTLILDVSGSMNYCVECGQSSSNHINHDFTDTGSWKYSWSGYKWDSTPDGNCDYVTKTDRWGNENYCEKTEEEHSHRMGETRIAVAKEALVEFLNNYADGANGAARYVSLVTFAKNSAKKDLDTAKSGNQYWLDVSDPANLNKVIGVINGCSANGGTNTQAGTTDAADLLEMDVAENTKAKSLKNCFAILLTDGEPTYYVNDNGDRDGSGSSASDETTSGAQTGCEEITETGAKLYSIAYCTAEATVPVKDEGNKTITDWLKNNCGSTKVYGPDSSASLKADLVDILKTQTESGSNVAQVVGKVNVVAGEGENNVVVYSYVNSSDRNVSGMNGDITWNLNNVTPVHNESAKTNTYTTSYQVRMNTEATGFVNAKPYALGETKLSFTDISNNTNHEVAFPAIAAQGYLGSLSFVKQGYKAGTMTNLQGAKFTLATENWSRDITTQEDGKVEYTAIPSGYSYTLTEATAPEGYDKVDPVSFAVKYGELKYAEGTAPISGTVEDRVHINTVDVRFTKTWQIPANENTPDEIVVTLLRNSNEVEGYKNVTVKKSDCTVDKDGVWSYTFTGLPATDDMGNAYTYTVKEAAMTGYTTSYGDNNLESSLAITNTASGKVHLKAEKTWILPTGMNTDPEEVTVWLTVGGEEVKGSEKTLKNGETADFGELDKYDSNGQIISYAVVEDPNGSYQQVSNTSATVNGVTTYTLTNTVAQETTTVSGTKSWKDGNDISARPASVTVKLYADGKATEMTATTNADASWQYKFEGLDRYEFTKDSNGVITGVREIVYTVKEADVGSGYVPSYNGMDVTNTRTGKVNFTVYKNWIDVAGAEHDEVTVYLYANNEKQEQSKTFSESATFEGLDKYGADGSLIRYSVAEEAIKGYTASYSDVTTTADGAYVQTVTNTKVNDDKVILSVEKVWQQPETVSKQTATFTVSRYSDHSGNKQVTTLSITGNGSTTYEADKYYYYKDENGEGFEEYTYNVVENNISGYNTTGGAVADAANANTWKFVNTITGKTSVTVNKNWVKPDSVAAVDTSFSVGYTTNAGKDAVWNEVGTIEIKAGETSGTLSGLEKYDALGQEIQYTVNENSISGFNASAPVKTEGKLEFTVTNTVNEATVPLTVTKTWIDGNTAPENRPAVKLTVLQNSTAYQDVTFAYTDGKVMATVGTAEPVEATVSEYGNTYSVQVNVPRFSDDKKVEYTYSLNESNVPAGYEKAVSGMTATNKRVGKISIDVTKYWIDPAGTNNRPEITLKLTGASVYEIKVKDGVATMGNANLVVAVNGSTWTITVPDLPEFDASGKKITYTLSENEVSGYTQERVENQPFAITNRIAQEKITCGATKNWANMDVDGVYKPQYPDAITVALYRDDMMVEGSEQTVQRADGTYAIETYTDLDKYASDGHIYKYEVLETSSGAAVKAGETVSFGTNNEYTVSYTADGTITNTFKVPAKYLYVITTNYTHYDYTGAVISTNSKDSEMFTKSEKQTITVSSDEFKVNAKDNLTYGFDAENETNVVSVSLDKENHLYKLVLNYVLTDEVPDAQYKVTHVYCRNGIEEDRVTGEPFTDKVGTVVNASNIGQITTGPNGRTYRFVSASPESITLEKDIVGELILTYNRTTGGGGGGTTPTPENPVTPPEDIDEPDVPLAGDPEIEDLGDSDVPLAGLPGDELEDLEEEEVPLAAVPKTSDMALFWLASSALSGIGLGALNLKKREDEDEQ